MVSTETVTYSFVQFYYQKLHEDPTKLYQIYTPNAKLTHSTIPKNTNQISNKSLETQVYSNKDEIEKFYAGSKYFTSSKIRVSSIDSQSLFDDSILINVIGELALNDESPVFRFTQSFVLTPGHVSNSYDITNDIFRLIPDDDFELNNDEEEVGETQEPEQKVNGKVEEDASSSSAASATTDSTTPAADNKEVEESKEKEPVKSEEPKQSSKASSPKEETKENTKQTPKEEESESKPKQKSKPVEKSSETTSANSNASTKPISWASLTAKAKLPKEKDVKVLSAPASTTSTASTSASTATVTSPQSPAVSTSTTSTSAPSTSTPSSTSTNTNNKSKNNKSNVNHYEFAVKVTNINFLKAPELKTSVEKAFGKTAKVEPKGQYGLIAFETKESQEKALNKGKLRIGEYVVEFEEKSPGIEFNDRPIKNKPTNNSTNNRQNNRQVNSNRQTSTSVQKKKSAK